MELSTTLSEALKKQTFEAGSGVNNGGAVPEIKVGVTKCVNKGCGRVLCFAIMAAVGFVIQHFCLCVGIPGTRK